MRYLVACLLLLGAHYTLTATMPAPAGKGWIFWPFAADSQAVLALASPHTGRFTKLLAVVAGTCFLVALLGLFGLLIPAEWWGVLVSIAAIASAVLYVLYFGVWALLPLAIDLFLLWGIFVPHWSVANLNGA